MKYHIYHHNDMDGHASGAIVAYGLENEGIDPEDILFYRMNYGQEFDDSKVDYSKDEVYVVDFSLQPYEQMHELGKKLCRDNVNHLVWIDHHATSYDWASQFEGQISWRKGILTKGSRAACELCWQYFFMDEPIPEIVKRISQYDIWNKDYPDFRWEEEQIPLQTYFRSIETKPSESMGWWRYILTTGTENPELASREITDMILQGQKLQAFSDKNLKSLTLSRGYEADLCGYKVFALNTPQGGSRQFEVAIDMSEYDMVCAYGLCKSEYWTVNLYSIKEGVHCGELAKKLGAEGPYKSGGGHPGAAGFQTSYEHLVSVLKPLPKNQ